MQELGFQACCLRCDAPDDAGLRRCNGCIQHHRSIRETVAASPPDHPLYQLAKEIMVMAAAPHRHDHDEVHGDALVEQQRLAAALVGPVARRTEEDVALVFEEQRATKKANVLRDVANQNPWRERAPEAEEAKKISEDTWLSGEGVDPANYGSRTVPSKPIQQVDRRDRPGEDTALTDRVHASAAEGGDDDVAEIFRELEFKARQQRRADLKSALDDVKDLVDDDLDF